MVSENHMQGLHLALILEARVQLVLHLGEYCACCGLQRRDGWGIPQAQEIGKRAQD